MPDTVWTEVTYDEPGIQPYPPAGLVSRRLFRLDYVRYSKNGLWCQQENTHKFLPGKRGNAAQRLWGLAGTVGMVSAAPGKVLRFLGRGPRAGRGKSWQLRSRSHGQSRCKTSANLPDGPFSLCPWGDLGYDSPRWCRAAAFPRRAGHRRRSGPRQNPGPAPA